MTTKTLENGTKIIITEKTPKEAADKISEDYKKNPIINTTENTKNNVNEISESRINEFKNNSMYNQINSHIKKEENNNELINNLQDSEDLSVEEISNKISKKRDEKLPKKVDLV